MNACQLNALDVVEGALLMPRVGLWHGDLVLNTPTPPAGGCTIKTSAGLSLAATVVRAGVWEQGSWVRVAGGAGGTTKTATAKHYRGITLRAIVGDLLRVSGDKLASSSDATTLGTRLQAWTLEAAPVGRALTALLGDPRTSTAGWRLLPDGTLWIGRETWPDAGLKDPDDYQDLDERPQEAWAELGFEAPLLQPGYSLGGRKLDTVQHIVTPESVRTSVWFAS